MTDDAVLEHRTTIPIIYPCFECIEVRIFDNEASIPRLYLRV